MPAFLCVILIFQAYNSVFSNTSMTFVVQNTITDATVRRLKHTLPLYLEYTRTNREVWTACRHYVSGSELTNTKRQ